MHNLVFTSAGDNTNFINWWCSDSNNYDIYVIYYGNNEENYALYAKYVTFIERRKGSKFQNFNYFYNKYPDIIAKYERFFILDDDIEIKSNDINRMFAFSEKYNLLICAPSFTHDSKISHIITKNKRNVILEYTNFIEINVPLFVKEALIKLMNHYDPILIGWGIDTLAIWANGLEKEKAYAIIHEITCRNPKEEMKLDKRRELSLIRGYDNRRKIWEIYALMKGCPIDYTYILNMKV
jgi:hypothetical protein